MALQDVAVIERLLDFMQEHGRADDVNLLDKHGYSALHCATHENVNEVVLMLLLRCPKIDCTLQNISNNTPLHYFCNNYVDPNVDHILDIFRQKHAQIDAVNDAGETPLHRAVLNRKPLGMVTGLIARQANVNAQTKKGHTPLHYCVNREGTDPAVADLLLRSGASPLIRDKRDVSPSDAARATGQFALATRLSNAERVALWLAQIGMSQYLHNFMAQDMQYDVLPEITSSTLKDMGITLTGHIMKIKKAVKALKQQEERSQSQTQKRTKTRGGAQFRRESSKLTATSAVADNSGSERTDDNDDAADDAADADRDADNLAEFDTQQALATSGAAADAGTVVASMAGAKGSGGLTTTTTSAIPFAASAALAERTRALLEAHPERSCRLVPTEALETGTLLGQGVSSFVFRGRLRGQKPVAKRVAIKVFSLTPADVGDAFLRAEAIARVEADFLCELTALLELRSPLIVVCRAVTVEPQVSLALDEYPRRSTYHVLHEPDYRLQWKSLLAWASDAAGAVSCMHQHSPPFVHRDLKLLNFLVTDADRVVLCDFGCAQLVSDANADELTQLKGTAFYAAPEVYFGERFELASDVYSLGICIWELVASLLAGAYVRPFSEYPDCKVDFQVFARAAQKNLRPTLAPVCPRTVFDLVAATLAPSADRRPTAGEVIASLQEVRAAFEAERDAWVALEGTGGGAHVTGAPCLPADDAGPLRADDGDELPASTAAAVVATVAAAAASAQNSSDASAPNSARQHRMRNDLDVVSPRRSDLVSPRRGGGTNSGGEGSETSLSSSRKTPRSKAGTMRDGSRRASGADAADSSTPKRSKARSLKRPKASAEKSEASPSYNDAIRSALTKSGRRAIDDTTTPEQSAGGTPIMLAKQLSGLGPSERLPLSSRSTGSLSARSMGDDDSLSDGPTVPLTTADVLPSQIALDLVEVDESSLTPTLSRSARVRKLIYGDGAPEPAASAAPAAPEAAAPAVSAPVSNTSSSRTSRTAEADVESVTATPVDSPSAAAPPRDERRRPATIAAPARPSARPVLANLDDKRSQSLRSPDAGETQVGVTAAAATEAPQVDVHSVFKEISDTTAYRRAKSPPPTKPSMSGGAAAVLAARSRALRTPSPPVAPAPLAQPTKEKEVAPAKQTQSAVAQAIAEVDAALRGGASAESKVKTIVSTIEKKSNRLSQGGLPAQVAATSEDGAAKRPASRELSTTTTNTN